jgi:DNA-directed RNA polymerase subunit K/omega
MAATFSTKLKDPVDFADLRKTYDCNKNISVPFMTIYEMTSLLSMRIQQLANGAPSMIKIEPGMSIRDIARTELIEKKSPFIICRKMPNGKSEYWFIEDLYIDL